MKNVTANEETVIQSSAFLDHWQGHRKLTRKVIEAFPEDQLFIFSIGGMRPFAEMVLEMASMASHGMNGVVTGHWTHVKELGHHSGKSTFSTKQELLDYWDEVTGIIENYWPQIPEGKFGEVVKAFGEYEGEVPGIMLYWVDNEIHHRGQGYVYLRALGIEPPGFWDRY